MKFVYVAAGLFCSPFLSQSHQLLGEQWRVNCININKHGLPLIICVTLCRGLPSPDPGFLLCKRNLALGELRWAPWLTSVPTPASLQGQPLHFLWETNPPTHTPQGSSRAGLDSGSSGAWAQADQSQWLVQGGNVIPTILGEKTLSFSQAFFKTLFYF